MWEHYIMHLVHLYHTIMCAKTALMLPIYQNCLL
nr:MAG TPA: hypothetical protein [Caudoviricetes sp.]